MSGGDNPTLADYLKAGYPCLYLPTVEPQIAEARVRAAVEEIEMGSANFGVWKVTTGLRVGRADSPADLQDSRSVQEDLIPAIHYVETQRDPIIAIFNNMRHFMSNHQVVQSLIDAIFAARLRGSHIILVGAHLDLPPELKTLVTYVECPLPTQDDIVEEYNKIITAYEDDIEIPKGKKDREELVIQAARAAIGLDMIGCENALALSLATSETVDIHIIQAQKEQEVKKSDVLEFWPINESIDNIGGFDFFKDWLRRREKAFSKEARDYGLPYPKGMLIVGPAGTGKSLTAKAVAHYLKLPLLRLDMGKVFRSLVGESEAAIRMALNVAEAVSPVVLWMDEVEKGLAGMKGSGDLDSGVTSRVVSTVLTWRQETKYPVMLVATANDVATIPSMVYRKGRLDEVWATDLPLEFERREIFKIHLIKRKRDPKLFDLKSLAKATPEFTGAEIEGCIEDAMFSAFDKGEEVATKHIVKAIRDTVPQALRDREELDAIREWVATRARHVSGGEPATKPKGNVRSITTGRRKK